MRLQPRMMLKQAVTKSYCHRQVIRPDFRSDNAGIRRRQFRIKFRRCAALCQKGDTLRERAEQALQIIQCFHQHIKRGDQTMCRSRIGNTGLVNAIKRLALMETVTAHRCISHMMLNRLRRCRCLGKCTSDIPCNAAAQSQPQTFQHITTICGGALIRFLGHHSLQSDCSGKFADGSAQGFRFICQRFTGAVINICIGTCSFTC